MKNLVRLSRQIGLSCVAFAALMLLAPAVDAQDIDIICWGPYENSSATSIGCAFTGPGCFECIIIVYSREECEGELCRPDLVSEEPRLVADSGESFLHRGLLLASQEDQQRRMDTKASCNDGLFDLVDRREKALRRKSSSSGLDVTAP